MFCSIAFILSISRPVLSVHTRQIIVLWDWSFVLYLSVNHIQGVCVYKYYLSMFISSLDSIVHDLCTLRSDCHVLGYYHCSWLYGRRSDMSSYFTNFYCAECFKFKPHVDNNLFNPKIVILGWDVLVSILCMSLKSPVILQVVLKPKN